MDKRVPVAACTLKRDYERREYKKLYTEVLVCTRCIYETKDLYILRKNGTYVLRKCCTASGSDKLHIKFRCFKQVEISVKN